MDKMRLFWEHLQRWTCAFFFFFFDLCYLMLTLQEELEVLRGEEKSLQPSPLFRVFPQLPFPLGGSLSIVLGTAWILFESQATLTPVLPASREPLRHLALLPPAHLCISAYSPPPPRDISSPQRCKSVHLLSSFLMPLLPTEALVPMKMAH